MKKGKAYIKPIKEYFYFNMIKQYNQSIAFQKIVDKFDKILDFFRIRVFTATQ